MNAKDILHYGQQTLKQALEGISDEDAENGFVTSMWNVHDVVGHLAAYEHVLEEVMSNKLMPSELDTPYLKEFTTMKPQEFNNHHYEKRKNLSYSEVLAEQQSAHDHIMSMIFQFTPDMLTKTGTLPWYGNQYSLEDFIVYHDYGHKREHSAQIRQFKKYLKANKSIPTKK